MSFPSGDVFVTPFVGAHDNNNGTVALPQGSEFSEDIKGDYYEGLTGDTLSHDVHSTLGVSYHGTIGAQSSIHLGVLSGAWYCEAQRLVFM